MSHNTFALAPYVTSFTPSTITEAGNKTLTISGNFLSANCKVDIPAGLGTIVSQTYTAPSATTGQLVVTINVATIPAASATYAIGLSNGGLDNVGVSISVILTDWTPDELVKSADSAWFKASDLSGHNTNVTSWSPTATTIASTVSALDQDTTYTAPVFLDGATAGSPTPFGANPFVLFGGDGTFGNGGPGSRSSLDASNIQGWDLRAYNTPISAFFCTAAAGSSAPQVYFYAVNTSFGNFVFNGPRADGDVKCEIGDQGSHADLSSRPWNGRSVTGITSNGQNPTGTHIVYHNGASQSHSQNPSSYTPAVVVDNVRFMGFELYVAEFIWCNYVVSPAEVVKLEAYWAAKYGALAT
jgi:hypothetical protein